MLTNGRHLESEYRQLAQVEDNNISESQESGKSCDRAWRPAYFKLLIISHLLIFGVYASGLWYVLKRKPSQATCIGKFSTHSPALPIITYESPKFLDAEIIQTNKYRGPPSPEIDTEWLRIGLGTPAIRLYEEDLKQLNKTDTPDRPLHRIPEEFGGGYLAMLEVFHLLHCLDALRKATHKDYYIKEWEEAGENAKRAHTDHCIDMLRETIMCTSDVTPITFFDNVLLPSRKLPMPDFSSLHTCRNFDAILDWNANNERTLQWDEIGLDLRDSESLG